MNKGKDIRPDGIRRIKSSSKSSAKINFAGNSLAKGKDKSSSMNSLAAYERGQSPKKISQKELNLKVVNEPSRKKKIDNLKLRKFEDFDGIKSFKFLNKNSSLTDETSTRSLETLTKFVDDVKLSPKLESKFDQRQKFFDELIQKEGSIEKLLQIKKAAKTVYDVDGMSSTEIRESLTRVDDKTVKPFGFLSDIKNDFKQDEKKITLGIKNQELNPTDIDLQLASLVKRVELNRTLLEKANQRIKDINFLSERNKMISLRDMNYDEESFLKMKDAGATKEPISVSDLEPVSHPAVDELQKTMNATIEMLGYVHKMSSGDLAAGEIPPELMNYLKE